MNAKEATKQLIDMGCKYLRIVSVDGDVILYQNPAKASSPSATKAQADKISLYVSKAPEGSYVIQGRTSPQARPTSFVVEKGEQAATTAASIAAPSSGISDHGENVLSYGAALKMQEELANLRAENSRLSDLVAQLQEDLEDLENSPPEEAPSLADNPAMSAIGQLAGILPGIVDQYFANQKEKQEIEKAKLMAMMQNRQNGYTQPNGSQQQAHEWE